MSWSARVKGEVGDLKLDVKLSAGVAPIALVGPNGSGKSTLLRVIAGAQRCTDVELVIDDEVIEQTSSALRRPIELRGVGYVPQGYGLFPHLDVLDNVAFGLRRMHSRNSARGAAAAMLQALDCGELASRRPSQLSGGEQQRVALARALVLQPRILLLDEPLAALDVGSRRAVRALLVQRLAAMSVPAVVVTHDVRDIAALQCVTYVLQRGRIVQVGNLAQLRASPATDFVRELVAG